jgi:hypothetical protein
MAKDFYGASDIDVMLAEFGVPVEFTVNGVTYSGYGIEDTTDEERLSDEAVRFSATFKVIVVKSGAFPGLAEGGTVTVNGTARRCIQIRREADGATSRVWLR